MLDAQIDDVDGRLREFLTSHHVEFGSISCMRIPGPASRGIVATDDIQANDILLSVPRRLLMGVESALRDEDIAKAVQFVSSKEGLCLSDQQLLAIHLLKECSKQKKSFWSPYILTIPRSYSTGYSLRDEHIEELQFSYAKRFLYQAKEECMQSYNVAKKVLVMLFGETSKWNTFRAWQWAISTLSSRTMFMPRNSIGVLCPYGDLHNYMWPPPPITMHIQNLPQNIIDESSLNKGVREENISGEGFFDATRDMYVLVSRRKYCKGEQVFLCYGRHTNLHLLCHYGFCLEDNPHNTAMIPIWHFPEKVQQHMRHEDDVFVHNNGYPSFHLMRSLRLASLNSNERKRYAFKILNDESVNPSSEIKAFSMLMEAVQKTLEQGSTSIGRDLDILKSCDIDECMFAVVSFRIYHKKALQRCIEICKSYIAIQMNATNM